MKNEFKIYLEKIGVKDLFLEKAESVLQFYEINIIGGIEDIIVTDYVDDQNNRHFENLWLFKGKYFMEAKQFLTSDVFDIATFTNRLKYIEIKKNDYDFVLATTKSRLAIHIANDLGLTGDLKVTQENCDYLRDIYKKYFINSLL